MAIDWQLRILLEGGAKTWNEWRSNNPNVVVDLFQAKLMSADLSYLDLSKANLQNSDLTNANLTKTNLSRANLKRSNLTNTVFKESNLDGTDISESNLGGTIFSDSQLRSTIFTSAVMAGTVFGSNDLSEIIGMDKIIHLGPSTIGKETHRKSKGNIPNSFLRSCGLSDLDIEYTKLLSPGLDPEQVTDISYRFYDLYVGKGIQYYSCFISYSSKDETFAQKIHDDLQNTGVRCWFAPEDMKIGDPIRPTIDRQIRLRDKLLVILSENSVKSEWVGDEVNAAFEEAKESKRSILFPIRLDDAVLNIRDDWAAKIKRDVNVGDFSNWQDKVSYQKAFERLLRDLKATGGQVNGE